MSVPPRLTDITVVMSLADDGSRVAKLCDLGLSRDNTAGQTKARGVGTKGYQPPVRDVLNLSQSVYFYGYRFQGLLTNTGTGIGARRTGVDKQR